MSKSYSSLLLLIVCACLGLTSALPVRSSLPTTDSVESQTQTRSPILRSLLLSGDHVSLLPEGISKSDKDVVGDVDTKLGLTDTTVSFEVTSDDTDSSRSRGVRSVTFSDTQVPGEPTTESITETETTPRPIQEQTTTVPKEEAVTTNSRVNQETTGVSSTELPTDATVSEVDLNQDVLDNASRQVNLVLAKIQKQNKSIGGFYINCDEQARPILPSDIVDNSKQCFQIQPTLQAIHEVLGDFLTYLSGLIILNRDTTVYRAVGTLDLFVTFLPSPQLGVYSAPYIQGADNPNTEEVLCTLQSLSTQVRIIKQVVLNLKNC